MVVRRTVHHMRTRPRHEREAFAAWIAVGVVVVLFLLWMVFFFRGIRSASVQNQAAPTAVQSGEQVVQNQNAAAAQAQMTQTPSSDGDSYDTNSTGQTQY